MTHHHLDLDVIRRLLQDRLSPEQAGRARRHVEQCDHCRRMVEEERSVMSVLHAGEDQPNRANRGAVDRLIERIGEADPRRHRRRNGMLLGVGIALTLLLLAFEALRPRQSWAEATAASLGITPRTQSRIVNDLHALTALRREPWLMDHYATVRALDVRLAAETTDDEKQLP